MILAAIALIVFAGSFAAAAGILTTSIAAVISFAADTPESVDVTSQLNVPTAIAAAGPTLLALGALFVLWRRGVFDIERRASDADERLRTRAEKERDQALADLAAERAARIALAQTHDLTPVLQALADGFAKQATAHDDDRDHREAVLGDLVGISDALGQNLTILKSIDAHLTEGLTRRRLFDPRLDPPSP